ncbi:hypothetical protein Deipr_2486 (plasmid) [Deinococcus proteolyticus MRP]|uniref:Uncharacterized protein n=1 Tax=Deinococcus proteolyticus (strain ATCC 35074 / DSM 20540 / JCM 6276 / NBRC 101906 / NCIMB 13154 / VKM Ac-1939 / CCM 2703 / MRP) TaxID=693977 RepID=F0RQP4_DEIPM|nr:hypothetical protein [Deinococcus proteolyticus]ADY27603.1 hypothetical protein Deipr_2486 [Deinococcus proteolyticus MRP]
MTKVKNPLTLPVSYAELIARTKGRAEASSAERMFAALQEHGDTREWLEKCKAKAFEKGFTREVLPMPAYGNQAERMAQAIVRDAIFAAAKNVRGGTITVPGMGKFDLTERDMLSPQVQYGLGGGSIPLEALSALQALDDISFVVDTEQLQQEANTQPEDWAHGEHKLQSIELGGTAASSATTAEEALAMLDKGDVDQEVVYQLQSMSREKVAEARRLYDGFKLQPWLEDEDRSYTPLKRKPEAMKRVQREISGSVVIRGDWDSLQVPRRLKALAFDRLVDLFEAAFRRKVGQQGRFTVTANTDDMVGKAAIMAAKRLELKTVSSQLAGYKFEPAGTDARFCGSFPKGRALERARYDLADELGSLGAELITLGSSEQISLAQSLFSERYGKSVQTLDSIWAKHNGLY